MQRNLFNYFTLLLKGIAMGAADVVPGVSGGTIAFISGIYQELIESINKINIEVVKTWKQQGIKTAWASINGNFLVAIFLGIVMSIFSLARLIKWLLYNEPILLWSFFFGLVLASIVFVAKQIQSWSVAAIGAIILFSVLSYCITLAEPFVSPESPFYLLFCGFIAIIAMILPGVSGAFILLILGAYQTAIDTINHLRDGLVTGNFELFKTAFFNFCLLAAGALVGLKVFSKVLNWMFTYRKNTTLAILTGFMIGSLNKIWPWKKVLETRVNSLGETIPFIEKSILPQYFKGENKLILSLLFMGVGFGIIFILERFGQKKSSKA